MAEEPSPPASDPASTTLASRFIAGWRPATGWVLASALAIHYSIGTMLAWGVWTYLSIKTGSMLPRPEMGSADMLGLLGSLAPLIAARSYDKQAGTDSKALAPATTTLTTTLTSS